MTAREIFEEYVICSTPIENRKEGYHNSIFEAFQTREIQRHMDKAKIEGEERYYPQAIEKLQYEIAEKSPTLFHLWSKYGNLQNDFLSESNLNNILNWIDQRLDERCDKLARESAENNYQHELHFFINNGTLILKLKRLLQEALEKRHQEVILTNTTVNTTRKYDKPTITKRGLSEIFSALKEKGWLRGNESVWIDMCNGNTAIPKIKLIWTMRNGKSFLALAELLSLIGIEKGEILEAMTTFFNIRPQNDRDIFSKLNAGSRSKNYSIIEDIVKRHTSI